MMDLNFKTSLMYTHGYYPNWRRTKWILKKGTMMVYNHQRSSKEEFITVLKKIFSRVLLLRCLVFFFFIPVSIKKKHKCQLCHKRRCKKKFCCLSESKSSDSFSKLVQRKSMNKMHHQRINSHSVSATFKVEFETGRRYIIASVNKIRVSFQFDTASDITLISRSTWERLGKPDLLKKDHIAWNASGYKIWSKLDRHAECFFFISLNTVINTFALFSDSEIENSFTHFLSDAFTENLGSCTKLKALTNWNPVWCQFLGPNALFLIPVLTLLKRS